MEQTIPRLELSDTEGGRGSFIKKGLGIASPRVCAPGAFSTQGRPVSPRKAQRPQSAGKAMRSQPRPSSPVRTRAMSPSRTNSEFNKFETNRAYRVGGGYAPNNTSRITKRSPEKDAELRSKVVDTVQAEAAGSQSSLKLNERQWEKVVTRLYGTPGGADDPMRRNQEQALQSTAPKLHPVKLEQTVERLHNPNPRKQDWLMQQRVAILERELRQCQPKPKISKTSERMASGKLHIVDRVDDVIKVKQQKMQELISRVEQDENEGRAISGSPYISHRAKSMTRSYQDLMSWNAERTERLQQQREAKVVDEISCPFHPEIDEYSEELAMRRFHKQEVTDLPAEERLYMWRDLPSEAQVSRARQIHYEDLKHSLALSTEY